MVASGPPNELWVADLTEVIRKRGPWRNLEDVEFATLEWVDWFNNRRSPESQGRFKP
jgi:hypothetical protein